MGCYKIYCRCLNPRKDDETVAEKCSGKVFAHVWVFFVFMRGWFGFEDEGESSTGKGRFKSRKQRLEDGMWVRKKYKGMGSRKELKR